MVQNYAQARPVPPAAGGKDGTPPEHDDVACHTVEPDNYLRSLLSCNDPVGTDGAAKVESSS